MKRKSIWKGENKRKVVPQRIIVAITLGILLAGLFQIMPLAKATPWSECHGITPFKEEADLVVDYTDGYYTAWDLEDWSKYNILYNSLPYADIWYFSGHGGTNWYGNPFLVDGDEEHIFGDQIPDLHDQHEFNRMRFAYASACYSAHTCYWSWVENLHDGFIDNGAEAYMGWDEAVLASTAYSFTDRFYHWAIDNGLSVIGAMGWAIYDVHDAEGNIHLFGDGSIYLIP
ncbi:MAG: hypothetical protein U9O96_02365 [Candidatus Thermoplasmatota archaeon]|nr:hypothetical protein [Candidatus Thermoplasmatota archaeon]